MKIRITADAPTDRDLALIEAARSPSHPDHARFEWDTKKAAKAYQLKQAKELIRLYYRDK